MSRLQLLILDAEKIYCTFKSAYILSSFEKSVIKYIWHVYQLKRNVNLLVCYIAVMYNVDFAERSNNYLGKHAEMPHFSSEL